MTFAVDAAGAKQADKLRMRVAPLLTSHHLSPAESTYVTALNTVSSQATRADLTAAATAAGVPAPKLITTTSDQWTQDASAAGLAVDAKGGHRPRSRRDTDLFRQVYDIAKHAGELDAGARRPGVPLTMHFKVLGNRALMPMLELLAFDGHAPNDLTPTAQAALRVGLIEAVGIVRDPRSIPVLARIALRERDVDTTRASADALGRLGTDDAFAALVTALDSAEASSAGGERVHALLAGVGSSRRVDGTKLLARKLDAHPDAVTARAIAKALGTAGNAWAWKTLSTRTDEATVRELAARSLVKAYVAYAGEARGAAAIAILVVDDAHTPALITEARRTASTDQATALDELAAKVAKNPTR